MAQKESKRRLSNGQRRLAISLTIGSFAASFVGARLMAAEFEANLEDESAERPDAVAPIEIQQRDQYSLDLQPIPTVALNDASSAAALPEKTFSLELEPVPTVDASKITIEEPPKTKSKSSK